MRRRGLLALAYPVLAQDETDVALETPSPLGWVRGGGKTHILFEVHLTNFSRELVELMEVRFTGANVDSVMDAARLDDAWMRRPGVDESSTPPRKVGPGLRAIVFVNLVAAGRAPESVMMSVRLRGARGEEFVVRRGVEVAGSEPLVLGPPLRGDGWVAMNALGTRGHHRRSYLAAGGRIVIPQRYAIDWVKLGADGKSHRGAGDLASYYGYREDVLAVADAVVADVRDGRPDRVPFEASKHPLPMDESTGNYVVLRLPGGEFAVYAHLIPGSVRVKKGQRVKKGEVLGRLGSSGMSDLPHLHFHVTDRVSPLAGDGVPYVQSDFTVQGSVGSIEGMLEGKGIVRRPDRNPDRRRKEMPGDLDVIAFA